jgi:hypothetical protein
MELRQLLDLEVVDIVATANEQGFATRDVLLGLGAAVDDAIKALEEDRDPVDDPTVLPAGPHSAPKLVDRDKTPGTGALPEPQSGEVDPGVG